MTSPPSRRERRKALTRSKLVRAAQGLLADDRGAEISIREITDRADVGFGSFYNYFETKEELFEAAVLQALDDHGTWLEAVLADERDPAVVFAASLRLTGRLHQRRPVLAGVLRHAMGDMLASERGLAPRARRDLVRAAEAGRLDIPDPDVALACAAGALVATLHLLAGRPDLDVGPVTDAMAAHVLRMFGLSAEEAARIVALPLPAVGP